MRRDLCEKIQARDKPIGGAASAQEKADPTPFPAPPPPPVPFTRLPAPALLPGATGKAGPALAPAKRQRAGAATASASTDDAVKTPVEDEEESKEDVDQDSLLVLAFLIQIRY